MENKRQHFVPVGYLKAWSTHSERGRAAPIWRIDDRREPRHVPCESVCAEDFLYTRTRTLVEKARFDRPDGTLPELVRRLAAADLYEQRRDAVARQSLLLYLTLLKVRNPDFDVPESVERLDVVRPAWLAVMPTLLGSPVARGDSVDDVVAKCVAMFRSFRMSVLLAPTGGFYTSENPVQLFFDADGSFELWAPLTPFHWVRFAKGRGETSFEFASAKDVHYLNFLTVARSDGAVFSRQRPADITVEEVREWIAGRAKRTERIDTENVWAAVAPQPEVSGFRTKGVSPELAEALVSSGRIATRPTRPSTPPAAR
ncbi:MAG: DUF4238 domain-containing protein [Deltaproteobacteria bacterium]|nr:DUF4238 domain-containing protein [Deltaproteobacteria bacterium]